MRETDEKVDSPPPHFVTRGTVRIPAPEAICVYSSLSLTPVQNKTHDAAQVWDHNWGRLYLQKTHPRMAVV